MMGAVLHTINVRLSPEQILYTINHAADDVILVNAEFLPLLEAIHDEIRPGVQARADQRRHVAAPRRAAASTASTSRCSRRRAPISRFRTLAGEHARDHVLHDRHHRSAQGRLLHPSAARAAHAGRDRRARQRARTATLHARRRVHADHADVPRARLGRCPTSRRCSASSRSIRAATCPTVLLGLIKRERRHLLALRADDPADDARAAPRPRTWISAAGKWSSAAPRCRTRSRARAVERGVDVFAGYGMSETCPILTLAHLRAADARQGRGSAGCRRCAAPADRFRSCSCASSTRR